MSNDICFICDTPFQIFNTVNFVANNLENCAGKSDIFIYKQFKNADTIIEGIRKSGLFNNVYTFNPYKYKNKLYYKFVTLIRILFPKHFLKQISVEKNVTFFDNKYSKIVLSFYTLFSDNLRLLNPDAEVVLIEDGTGSYAINDLETHFRSKRFSLLNKYFLHGKLIYNPQKFFVNSTKMCSENLPYKFILSLPSINNNNPSFEKLKDIFNYLPNTYYKNNKYIYLTQPIVDKRDIISQEYLIVKKIEETTNQKPLLRVHPRQNTDEYKNFQCEIDTINNMWELECMQNIADESIIFSAFSTAQFTPKLLFNKAPYIIFLYKIFGLELKGADDMIEKFSSVYNYMPRIFIPNSIEEINDILKKIKEE